MNALQVEVVLAWHAALNAGDTARLLDLSASDIEVGGPRGSGRGAQLLLDWVGRAHIQLEPLRWQAEHEIVVVEESARWQRPDGQLTEAQSAASVFRVEDGKVSSVIRLGNFSEALELAHIQPSPST